MPKLKPDFMQNSSAYRTNLVGLVGKSIRLYKRPFNVHNAKNVTRINFLLFPIARGKKPKRFCEICTQNVAHFRKCWFFLDFYCCCRCDDQRFFFEILCEFVFIYDVSLKSSETECKK